jgi:hypothetical protein
LRKLVTVARLKTEDQTFVMALIAKFTTAAIAAPEEGA